MVVGQINWLCAWIVFAPKLFAAQLEVECIPFVKNHDGSVQLMQKSGTSDS